MKRRGLTLIELAISIALLSVVLLWSVIVFNNLGKGSSTSSDLEIATLLASQKIEELKTYNYSQLSGLSSTQQGPFSSPYDQFSYKIVLTNENRSGNFYIIDATVYIYKGNSTTPLITMDANFVRSISDGKDIGL